MGAEALTLSDTQDATSYQHDPAITPDLIPGSFPDPSRAPAFDGNYETPSDEEQIDERGSTANDAQNAIGISISHTQSRLANPHTSAVEKARALIDGGAADVIFDDDEPDVDEAVRNSVMFLEPERRTESPSHEDDNSPLGSTQQLPMPQVDNSPTAGTHAFMSSRPTVPKIVAPDSERRQSGARRRAATNPTILSDSNEHGSGMLKLFSFNLSSLPFSSSDQKNGGSQDLSRSRSSRLARKMSSLLSTSAHPWSGLGQHQTQDSSNSRPAPRRVADRRSSMSDAAQGRFIWRRSSTSPGDVLSGSVRDSSSSNRAQPLVSGSAKLSHEPNPKDFAPNGSTVPAANDRHGPRDGDQSDQQTNDRADDYGTSTFQRFHRPARPGLLRRTTSDNSLPLERTLSGTSSLGDDSRFENVQDQVNSRLKAIKDSFRDSLQDSNFGRLGISNLSGIGSNRAVGLDAGKAQTEPVRGPQRSDSVKRNLIPSFMSNTPRARSGSLRGGRLNGDRPTSTASLENAAYPLLSHALEELTGDVVIMGGYRGSILRSAKPPHRQLWIPVKVGLNLRRVDLEVGLEPEDEERMEESVIPSGMLTHVGPVDISRRLFRKLNACENAQAGRLRVWDYGYDWRLSPHLLSKKLIEYLESLPCNQAGPGGRPQGATVVAHSLGGLITRHAVNQRPELFAGIIYAGVPHHCVNILGPFRNGDEVLLSSRVLTAQVNFTLRTSFALLPEDGKCFFDKRTGEQYPIDFFDPDAWTEHRFSPCVGQTLPPLIGPNSTGFGGIFGSVAENLSNLSIPGKKYLTLGVASGTRNQEQDNVNRSSRSSSPHLGRHGNGRTSSPGSSNSPDGGHRRNSPTTKMAEAANHVEETERNATIAPQMESPHNPASLGKNPNSTISTAVTIPREDALRYLRRTLAETRKFKEELHYRPELADSNRYPPIAVLYGKSVPTVYGARVDGREGIKHADAYDDLAFASGDGVCLARAAMPPEGYRVVKGGKVSSERGHVSLLGDLEGVGKCLNAIINGRRKGIGKGLKVDAKGEKDRKGEEKSPKGQGEGLTH